MISDGGTGITLKPTDTILWPDSALLAANKPAGLAAVPGAYEPGSNLLEVLEPTFGHLWIVHRLDCNTGGVIVLARKAAAHRALDAQFREHRVSSSATRSYRETPPGQSSLWNCPYTRTGTGDTGR